jgi:hypothetical protein
MNGDVHCIQHDLVGTTNPQTHETVVLLANGKEFYTAIVLLYGSSHGSSACLCIYVSHVFLLRGLSPRANYTNRALLCYCLFDMFAAV